MGLDMYAYRAKFTPSKEVDFQSEIPKDGVEDLHYWRKHPDLHGLMHEIYLEKGGTDDQFNCSPVVLTLADLDRIEEAIKDLELPKTSGFFFGSSSSDEDEINDDLQFVKEARQAIADGDTVWYDSWW